MKRMIFAGGAAALGLVSAAQAAVLVDATGATNPTIDQTLSTRTLSGFSVADNADRLLVVAVSGEEVGSVDSVTYGGVSLTEIVETNTGPLDATASGNEFLDTVAIWYTFAPAVGSADIVASVTPDLPVSTSSPNFRVVAGSFYNVDSNVLPTFAIGTNPLDSATASLGIAVTEGGLIFESISTNGDEDDSQSLTATADQTVIDNQNINVQGGYTTGTAYEIALASGLQTQTWSLGAADEHGYAAVAFASVGSVVIPEPASLAVLAAPLGLSLMRRRRA